MADEDYLNDPDDPDESDVCPHGKGFSEYCGICDEEDDYEDDEAIPVCPECGSDDLEIIDETDEGDNEYVCNDCGERFVDGEEEDA